MKKTLTGVCLLILFTVITIAVLRMNYPFELEWMEGASLQQVQRLHSGQALYVPPTLEFTPLLYTPLYFDLSARLSSILGPGFLPLRLLSLGSWLVSLGLIFLLVFRHTRHRLWSLVGATAYAACFEIGGAWFDIARVDSLFVTFILGTWFLLELASKPGRPAAWRYDLLAALFVTLAFLTKQSTLLVLFPLALYTLIFSVGPRRWLFPLLSFSAITFCIAALDTLSGGWFTYYVFELAASHAIEWRMLVDFWRFDLLAPLPFMLTAWLIAVWHSSRRPDRRELFWLLALSTAFILPAWFSRLHSGGYANVVLPAYAFLAVQFARTLCDILEPRADSAWEAFQLLPSAAEDQLRHTTVMGVVLLQFAILAFNPLDQLPDNEDRRAGQALMEELRAIKGNAWLPSHPWMAHAAGGPSLSHKMALLDVLRSGDTPEKLQLDRSIRESLNRGRWEMVITDRRWYPEELARHYQLDGRAMEDSTAFWPVTGMRTRPEHVFSVN